MTNALIPTYLDVDFATMKARLQDLLAANATFKDYNYEGSNITILIELVAYLTAMTTYYGNKIAQNQYIDTAELYETVHMLARQRGYNPKGYISSAGTITVSLDSSAGVSAGDSVKVPAWKQVDCSVETDNDGNLLRFATTTETTESIPLTASFPYVFDVPVRQGTVVTYTYTGADIIDNKIYLPNYNFDYDGDLEDQSPSIELVVGDVEWTRLPDFYNTIDGLDILDTGYMFKYDKYQRYYIEFSSLRTVPEATDVITVSLLKSVGVGGNVGTGNIDTPEDEFVYNTRTLAYLDNEYITITNPTTTSGEANPEVIDDIKESSMAITHSQYRNVTKNDYISHLESREDVIVANVWGEQEISPSGSFEEYNKVYISLIPYEFGTGTISTVTSSGYEVASAYDVDWKSELAIYLEPYKMISAWEEFIVPDLVYFSYVIGIKVKRTYDFGAVAADVLNKLIYYFRAANRSFNDTISFTDIIDYIMDTSYVSTVDNFTNVSGVQTLVIREINVYTHEVVEPNVLNVYPQYTTASTAGYDNTLRHIKLGHNQFPILDYTICTFVEET